MTRAILEFELPEDDDDFTIAAKGRLYFCCLCDIDQELRRLRKYAELKENQQEIIEELGEFFHNTVGSLLEEIE